ncbi:hypothetical protein [Streptomyces antibioticus]|uniref:hypothetical protein n=1 Tax=Streptomyces antibioticus TaxID=1890 RepID=UPI0033A3FA5D
MNSNPWFVVEDPEIDGDEPWDFDTGELAFIEALQTRAASWRVDLAHSSVGRPEDDSSLMVWVSLSDGQPRLVLGEWAVHFYGTHVRAGSVCDQLFNLDETPASGFFRASGPVEQLAERCAAWFEAILTRPVLRMEWLSLEKVYATGWIFADTVQPLGGSRDHTLTPTSRWNRRTPHSRHHRCTLIRGDAEPQPELHAHLCPYGPGRR